MGVQILFILIGNDFLLKHLFNNVVSWLVSRFAIVPKIKYSKPMHCLVGSLFCQKNGIPCFSSKKKCVKKSARFFWRKCFSPSPKRIRPLIEPLLKNRFSRNFQGTGPWDGPIHFNFVLRVHNCSIFFQSWAWSQEKKGRPFPNAIAKFKAEAFPKRIRPLIKPLLKNRFSRKFQGTGPWDGPVHFNRFVLRVHNCPELILEPQESNAFYKNMFFSFYFSFSFPFSFSFSWSASSSSSSSLFLFLSFPSSFSFSCSFFYYMFHSIFRKNLRWKR